MDEAAPSISRKKSLPTGAWLLATADALFCGLLPLITTLILFQNPEANLTTADLIILVIVSGGIIAAAIGTLTKDNFSRLTLLALITIYWSLRLFNSLGAIRSDAVTISNFGLVYGDLWRPFFWVGLNWWYWMKRSISDFYRS